MARQATPIIPDDKLEYFKEQLYSELSHMFTWEGLPESVPSGYLERKLIRTGTVMFYEDEALGHDVLQCTVTGYNRHEQGTQARTYVTSDDGQDYNQTRTIKRLSDSKVAVEQFDKDKDCVLIQNMAHGQTMTDIVDHFAARLALAQQSFDTSLLWTNLPYIFTVDNEDTRLSIEKMFSEMFLGKPFVISDKMLFAANKDRAGVPTSIQYIGKEIMDTMNEITMKFRERVGFETAGVDKAERLLTAEVKSNNQHTATCREIMLSERQSACNSINAFYDLNVSVKVTGQDEGGTLQEEEQEGAQEDGTDDSGTEALATTGKL